MTFQSLGPGFPLVERLAWMLIHSVWQGTVLAILLAIIIIPARKVRGAAGSNLRYGLACAAMLAFVASALLTFLLSGKTAPVPNTYATIDRVGVADPGYAVVIRRKYPRRSPGAAAL